MNNKKAIPERTWEMYELRETMTLQEVGDVYGISRERVRQILRDAGLNKKRNVKSQAMRDKSAEIQKQRDIDSAPRKQRKAMRLLKLAFALEDYKRGYGYNYLKKKYGLSQKPLMRYIKEKGFARTQRESIVLRFKAGRKTRTKTT